MSSISIEDAKRAKEKALVEFRRKDHQSPVDSRRLLREYFGKTDTLTSEYESADATADPVRVDHSDRRDTRMAPLSFDVQNLPKFFVECGCGDCPTVIDPLEDPADYPFSDITRERLGSLDPRDVCPKAQPVRLWKAREAYLRIQKADHNAENRTSLCEKTRIKHGKILGAERELYEKEYGADATVILFSFRQSPVEYSNGQRQWVTPVELDNDLHKSWSNIRGTLKYQISDKLGLEYEYIAITSTTTIAATPHTHMVVMIEDPDDEVTIDVARSVVSSHVNNCPRAYADHHPVEDGERDAAILHHDPPISTYPRHMREGRDGRDRIETAQKINRHQDRFTIPNTRAMEYVANQRPHWVIENVYDGTTDVHRNSVLVDGGAVAWARQHNWIKSSGGLDLQNGTVDRS